MLHTLNTFVKRNLLQKGGGQFLRQINQVVSLPNSNEYVEIDVKTIGQSDLAVRFNGGDKNFWIPKSCMEDWPNLNKTGTALVIRWFAEEKELI